MPRCLESLRFCDQLVVIDIDSADATADIAAAHGAEVIPHPYVEIAERARMNLVGRARHDWLLFLDPDEVFPRTLAEQIGELLPTLAGDVAAVDCPWQFFFHGKPLAGTIWGGINRKRTLARRGGVHLYGSVHSGTHLRVGFRAEHVPYTGDNAIAHYWVPGYRSLILKHWRYLQLEGPDRRERGLVTGYRDIAGTPGPAFVESFFRKSGYRDGLRGLTLSLIWAAYSTGAKVSLLRELRRGNAG